jgi:hypothetical protein
VEGLDLPQEVVDERLARDDGEARDVVDRLLGVQLRALPADLRQDVDEMGADVEEAELEHGEEADRPRADDEHIRFDRLGHGRTRS